MRDFNRIRQWITPLLEKKGLTIEQCSRRAKLSRATLYSYMVDRYRPNEQTMAAICRVLNRPLEEGLRQYTSRKAGRPKGMLAGPTPLRPRS